jgi:hypothetical protein
VAEVECNGQSKNIQNKDIISAFKTPLFDFYMFVYIINNNPRTCEKITNEKNNEKSIQSN